MLRFPHAARWPLAVAALALAAVGCSVPQGPQTGPSEAEFGPGTPFVAEDGSSVATTDEAFDEALSFESEIRDAPEVPLPDGVTPVGPVRRITADGYAASGPDAPFVLALPVPDEVSPDHLAIAYFDRGRVEFGEPIGDEVEGTVAWVFLDAFFDDETRLLFAPVYDVTPEGWEAVIVRSDRFETGRTTSAESLSGQQTFAPLDFEATCSPLFDGSGVPETCGDTERGAAAGDLENVYDDLTGLGFTDQPKLTFEAEAVRVAITSLVPLQYDVRVDPAAWVMELRPASQVNNAGMYSSGSGSFWAAIGTGGVTAGTRTTIRHEYFHATQYGYDPDLSAGWLRARFSIEGQAVLSENSVPALDRDGFGPRAIDDTLLRSRWTGSSWGPAPFSEYQAQDFWLFLGERGGHTDLAYIAPFAEEGMAPEDVDVVLERDWSGTYPDGLEDAYWDWVKNQAFEARHDLDGAMNGDCTFDASRVSTVDLTAGPAQSPSATFSLGPVTSDVVAFELSNTASTPAGFDLSVSLTSADQRVKFYAPGDGGSDACWGDLELPQASVVVPAGDTVTRYALVSNVGLGSTISVTAQVQPSPILEIVTPEGSYRQGDTLDFRADLSGLADASGVDIAWSATDAEDQAVSLPFTTTSGATESYADLPCTDLLIRAEATLPGGETVFDVRPVSCVPPVETYVYDVNRALSGIVTSDGRTQNGDDVAEILVGDDAAGNELHGMLHFDLPTLPEDLVEIVSATLVLPFETPSGTPFSDFGELNVVHVDYGSSLDASNYRGAPTDTTLLPGFWSTTDTDFGTTELDVTLAVDDAWANRGSRGRKVQFMPYVEDVVTVDGDPQDDDGVADHYRMRFEDQPGTTLLPSIEIEFRNY